MGHGTLTGRARDATHGPLVSKHISRDAESRETGHGTSSILEGYGRSCEIRDGQDDTTSHAGNVPALAADTTTAMAAVGALLDRHEAQIERLAAPGRVVVVVAGASPEVDSAPLADVEPFARSVGVWAEVMAVSPAVVAVVTVCDGFGLGRVAKVTTVQPASAPKRTRRKARVGGRRG